MNKFLFMNWTKGDFFLSGEKVYHTEDPEFSFEEFEGEIHTIGTKKLKQVGYEIDTDKYLGEVFAGIDLIDYIGYTAEIPDITLEEFYAEIQRLYTKPSEDYTQDEWLIYHLAQVINTNVELQLRTKRPLYEETNTFEDFDCPLLFEGRTIQPINVFIGGCGFGEGSGEDIIVAWNLTTPKVEVKPRKGILRKRGE